MTASVGDDTSSDTVKVIVPPFSATVGSSIEADGRSSFVIVPVPCPSVIVLPTGFDRLTSKVSSASTVVSPRIGTLTVVHLQPPPGSAAVPLVAV